MAKLRVRYLTSKTRSDGTKSYYWTPNLALRKAGWKTTPLGKDLPTAMTEAERLNAQVDQWRAGDLETPTTEKPGTIAAAIAGYKNSRHFKDLRPKTQRDYNHYLDKINEWAGDMLTASINAKMVQDLYESVRGQKPRKAMYLIQVMRILFNYAENQAIIPKGSNPAAKPRISYKAPKGKLWSEKAVKAFTAEADRIDQFAVGTAIMINEWIGQRRGDLLSLRMDAYQNGVLSITQSKTGAFVEIDLNLVPHIKARLDEQIRRNRARKTPGTALIQKNDGRPFTADGFRQIFDRIRHKCGDKKPDYKDLVFMHLRHTAVTRLAEMGCTLAEIAAITGHTFKSAQSIIDRYNITTTKMAQSALLKRTGKDSKS